MPDRQRDSLTLFVNGHCHNSVDAMRALRTLSTHSLIGDFSIRIVNILAEPHLGQEAGVVVTPTLILRTPKHESRCIGSAALSYDALVEWLNLPPAEGLDRNSEPRTEPDAKETNILSRPYELTLCLNSASPSSSRAIEVVQEFACAHLADRHSLEVIDVLEQPRRAREMKVVVTPTLIASRADSEARCIGRRVLSVDDLRDDLCPTQLGTDVYPRRVIIVEGRENLEPQLDPWLRSSRIPFTAFDNAEDAVEALLTVSSKTLRAVIVVDLDDVGIEGLRRLTSFIDMRPGAFHVIAHTRHPDARQEIEALQLGVSDYLGHAVEGRNVFPRIKQLLWAFPTERRPSQDPA